MSRRTGLDRVHQPAEYIALDRANRCERFLRRLMDEFAVAVAPAPGPASRTVPRVPEFLKTNIVVDTVVQGIVDVGRR